MPTSGGIFPPMSFSISSLRPEFSFNQRIDLRLVVDVKSALSRVDEILAHLNKERDFSH